ncbi:MAG: hypothetical protein ACRBK7_20845 [Acidimicrobiales bacterium]
MDADADLLAKYWDHQYQRVGRLEEQRMTFTNIIVASSVVALALLVEGEQAAKTMALAGAFTAILAANVVAVAFIFRTRDHVRQHLVRSHATLHAMSPTLFALNRVTSTPTRRLHSVNNYQVALHVLLAALALVALAFNF